MASSEVKKKIDAINAQKRAAREIRRKGETVNQAVQRLEAQQATGFTVRQPERDESGKTATDRRIEANKAAQTAPATQSVSTVQSPEKSMTQAVSQELPQSSVDNVTASAETYLQQEAQGFFDPLKFGSIQPATAQQSAAMSPAGEFIAGIKTGFGLDKNIVPERDIETVSGAEAAGRLASFISILQSASGLTNLQSASQLNPTGTINTIGYELTEAGNVAKTFQVNAATQAATSSWFGKMGLSKGAADLLKGAIGTFPFAWFIREEADQVIRGSFSSAYWNDDEEGMAQSLEFRKELANPSVIDNIKQGIPFINLWDSFDKFFEAVRIGVTIDEKVWEDKRKELNGEAPDEQKERINSEEEASYKENEDKYNERRKEIVLWEQEAKAAERIREAAFWAKEKEKQRELEAKDREAIAEFWFQYRKRLLELSDSSRPSNLNFGLL